MLLVLVFILFMIKNIITGAIKDIKVNSSTKSTDVTQGTSGPFGPLSSFNTNSQTTGPVKESSVIEETSSRCSQAVVNSVLVKNSKQFDASVGMYGKIQGGIYGVLRCVKGSISESFSDPVLVGVFPLLAGKDLSNGIMKVPTAPLYTGSCSGSLPTCYQIYNIPPGTYSVLVDRGQGWYCDSGVCKVEVDSGMVTTFDMITDK